MLNCIYDYDFYGQINSKVYVKAIGGDFVLFRLCYKYFDIFECVFISKRQMYIAMNYSALRKIDTPKIKG